MARIPERKFDPSKPIYARKAFTANGNKIAGGQQFDWKKLAVAQRRVLQMFEAGYLYHADSKPVNVTVEDKTTVKPTPEPVDVTFKDKIEELAEIEDNPLESMDYYDEPTDELDAIDDMKELRAIADAEGAPYKVSKKDQRQAIRDNRADA
jgi:hypothetical protein